MVRQDKSAASDPDALHQSSTEGKATAFDSTQAEQAPTPGEAKFRRLFDSNILGIIVADLEGHITEANDFFLRLMGYTRDDLPLRWDVMTPPDWRDQDESKISELRTTGEGVPWEKEYISKDGRRVSVLVGAALLEGTADDCIAVVLDLTERREVEQRLVGRKAQLQALAAELVLSEERERRRIARVLHGDVGHSLATARMKLGLLQEAQGSPVTEESIKEIRALLDAAIVATRSLTFELTSPVLYELGLEAALRSLGSRIEAEHGLRFHFETDGQPKPMTENSSVVLYRVSRELLFNIVKHAQAKNAWLRVEREEGHLRLTLADDGIGFDSSRFGSGFDQDGGFGLFNIRQQLDYIRGRVEIDSAPGGGTRIAVIAPLS